MRMAYYYSFPRLAPFRFFQKSFEVAGRAAQHIRFDAARS